MSADKSIFLTQAARRRGKKYDKIVRSILFTIWLDRIYSVLWARVWYSRLLVYSSRGQQRSVLLGDSFKEEH